jgi:ElaB/YqjD/DUF883 family membrane-anchored ribosome-binding protein
MEQMNNTALNRKIPGSMAMESKIEETKSSLQKKLTTLKNEVETTMATASENVQDTVETIKKSFNISHQIETHPWFALGVSVSLGYLLHSFLLADDNKSTFSDIGTNTPTISKNKTSRLSSIAQKFEPEIKAMKGLVVGSSLGYIGNIIKDSLPISIKPEINRVFTDLKAKAQQS